MIKSLEELETLLKTTGIPVAYHHFESEDAAEPPFICYLTPGSNNFAADGVVYHRISEVSIELYTDKKDLPAERSVEDALDSAGFFYNKTESWIESEQLYEVVFNFEMEV